MSRATRTAVAFFLLLGLLGPPARAQEAAASPTLWSFLGIPQGVRKVRGALTNRRGNHPGLEPGALRKALNDPANLAEGMPKVMQKAAEVKIAEDMKPQKIKAIKYLAKTGCGCYDLDGSITQALVESAGDCTEEVRLATVEAIAEAAQGKCCANCGETCCCKEPIVKKLASMAYERDDHGCYIEPSTRIREAAARALAICCPDTAPVPIEEVTPPEPLPSGEGPEGAAPDTGEGLDADEDNQQPSIVPPTAVIPAPVIAPSPVVAAQRYARPVAPTPPQLAASPAAWPAMPPLPAPVLRSPGPGQTSAARSLAPAVKSTPSLQTAQHVSSPSPAADQGYGVIVGFQAKQGMAHVHFAQRAQQVPTGTRLTVYRRDGSRHRVVGHIEIQESFPGASNIRAAGSTQLSQLRAGDIVTLPFLTAAYRPADL